MKKINKKALLVIPVLIAGYVMLPQNNQSVSATVPYTLSRISTDSSGNQQNSYATDVSRSTSKDGRYVVFSSNASNLVSGDTNGLADIFVKDTSNGVVTRVNVASNGTQANSYSSDSFAISYDGRYVAFMSDAYNLVSNDTNWHTDVFVHDMQTGTTELVSKSTSGTIGNDTSGSGGGQSIGISRDGRYVVYDSLATNLVSGDTNGQNDVFVRDRKANTTTRVSLTTSGGEANYASTKPSISCDGSLITFQSDANNIVSGDTNGSRDIFLVNRIGGYSVQDITLTGNADSGLSDAPKISCDGSTVVYASNASNLVSGDTNAKTDIFAYDVNNETTTRESLSASGSQASAYDFGFSVSGDGHYITFETHDSSVVSGDTNGQEDVFLRDRTNNTTEIVTKRDASTQTTSWSRYGALSPDGQYIVFVSADTGYVASDTNGASDVFKAATGSSPCAL